MTWEGLSHECVPTNNTFNWRQGHFCCDSKGTTVIYGAKHGVAFSDAEASKLSPGAPLRLHHLLDWCGLCVASMTHASPFYFIEQPPSGLKVAAAAKVGRT